MKMAKKFLLILSIVALMVASVSIVAFAATGDVNTADLSGLAANSSYTARTFNSGWKATNAAVMQGGTTDSNPTFKVYGDSSVRAVTLNGKTTAVGTLTSPTLTGGISELTFSYTNPFGESNGVDITINVNQDGAIVDTYKLDDNSVTKLVAETFTWTLEEPIEGDFVLEFKNNSPSKSTSNKDRVSLWNISWISYEAPAGGDEPEVPVEKTPAEKVEYVMKRLSIDTLYKATGIYEGLHFYAADFGSEYEDVEITWTSSSENLVFDAGEETVIVTIPEEDETLTVTVTVVCEDVTDTNTFEVLLDAPIKPLDAFVPVEGIGYKFAMLHTTNEKTYYITGAKNGYYMATTTNSDSAAIVYIENTDDGFYMYTFVNGAKKYMNMTVSGTHVNATFDDTASTVFTYSTKINGPVATVSGTEYGFGTYNTYTTVGTNKTSFAGSSANYYGQFVEMQSPISFEGAALNINNNIDMMYYVAINGEATDVSATFKFCGKTTTVTEYTIGEDGRYCFVFKGITPDLMGVNVEITVSATYGEASFTATDNSMSVRTYYEIAKEYCAEDTKLLTLMSDVLVYGAAVQTWIGDNEDELVTYGLELTPSTTEFVAPETMLEVYGESFKSATLVLGSTITVRFTVAAEEDAVIRVALNEKVAEYNVADLAKDAEGNYIVEFKNVYASECDNAIWASIVGTDECVRYSVNSYISEMANADDADLVALVKALYIYGVTADAYN